MTSWWRWVARRTSWRGSRSSKSSQICVAPEDIHEGALAGQREKIARQAAELGKPEHVTERIVNGRIEKWISSQALLTQGYVKHPEKAVGGLLRGMIRAIG